MITEAVFWGRSDGGGALTPTQSQRVGFKEWKRIGFSPPHQEFKTSLAPRFLCWGDLSRNYDIKSMRLNFILDSE